VNIWERNKESIAIHYHLKNISRTKPNQEGERTQQQKWKNNEVRNQERH
jgi:hypothetical protein